MSFDIGDRAWRKCDGEVRGEIVKIDAATGNRLIEEHPWWRLPSDDLSKFLTWVREDDLVTWEEGEELSNGTRLRLELEASLEAEAAACTCDACENERQGEARRQEMADR